MKKILLFILFFFLSTIALNAQSFNMTVTGHQEQTSSNCTIYDDGGASGNYNGHCNSSFTVIANNNSNYFYITGTYNLEGCSKAKLTINDGGTMSQIQLGSYCNSGTINICSNSPRVTFRFETDSDTPLSGFVINCLEASCPRPTSFYTSDVSITSATLNWTGTSTTTNWIIECTTNNMPNGQNTFSSNSNSVTLNGLEPFTDYCFRIRSDCLPITACSYMFVCFKTLCPCPPAGGLRVEKLDSLTIRVDWVEIDPNTLWIVTLSPVDGPSITIETNNPYYIFQNLPENYPCYTITISSRCAGFDDICNYTSISIPCPPPPVFECNCPKAIVPQVTNVTNNSVDISWVAFASPGWIVEYYPVDDIGNRRIDTVHTNSISVNNLEFATLYIFNIHSYCDNFDFRCCSSVSAFTYGDKCFDFLDLRGSNCTTTYGNYYYPDERTGLLDYGYYNIRSRHTIHKDTSERDPRTNSLLQTIPLGEPASVRLGNWEVGAEAESITYQYYIDTNNFDLMILKYAIVLQDPNHTVSNQPRFTLAILGESGRIEDDLCGYTNFYASGELGWNSATTSFGNVIWKDWTTMGVDLAQYHGQRIAIKLTTYDCEEGGHFGYAYFTLNCERKDDIQSTCGNVDSTTLTAPNGFNYKWYKEGKETNIISTQRQITVLVDNTTFYCKCISKESEYCYVLMKFVAERLYPFAQFSYSVNSCTREVTFINTSIISNSETYPNGYKHIDSIQWIFHNDSISTLDTVRFTYDSLGIYQVKLIASMNNGDCVDTVIQNIVIEPFYIDTIRAEICSGEIYNHNGFEESEQGIYTNRFVTEEGCDSVVVLNLKVWEIYNQIIYDTMCEGGIYNSYGFSCTKPDVYVQNLESIHSCDSIITLYLSEKQLYEDFSVIEDKYIEAEDYPIIIDATCESCLAYFWNTGSTNPIIHITYPGSYYLSIYTDCGTIYDSVLVVSPEIPLFLPNSFTPLLDKNNTFFPIYANQDKVTIELFEIYNRWGDRIYSSTSIPWDGKYQNNVVSAGVYVWHLVYKTKYSGDTTYKKSGYIHLIR